MDRREGSGLATRSATAIEEMLASALRGDDPGIRQQEVILQREEDRGSCGIAPAAIRRWVVSVVRQLALPVTHAQRALNPGDVVAVLKDGTRVWFEVKAQTKKARFADITQADWVRDGTDAVRWLAANDPGFARRLPPAASQPLSVRGAAKYFGAWTFRDLWLADLVLLPTKASRDAQGVAEPNLLGQALTNKFLFHITQEGARAIRLADLPVISEALGGGHVTYTIKVNSSSLVAVPVAVGANPEPQFTYHVYDPDVPGITKGRHKLHGRVFDGARFIES